MKGIIAIALLTVRSAIRSKIVVVLLVALAVVLMGLPLTLRSDGTLTGHIQILLRYTPGLALLILSMATIWAACAAVSRDIEDRQIQMILAKPVRALDIWFGKWLGLCAMNFVLIILCASATWLALQWHTSGDKLNEEDRSILNSTILVAQRRIVPIERDLREPIEQEVRDSLARGEWPTGTPASVVRERVAQYIRSQANTVATGSYNRWIFNVPDRPPAERPLVLRYRFSTSLMHIEPIMGIWRAGAEDHTHRFLENVEVEPNVWHTLQLPPDVIGPQGQLVVDFANTHDRMVTILFNPSDGLNLLVYAGGFSANFIRAFLLLFFHLAFLAAIGITAGSFFSVPVAALVSFYALILLQAGRFISEVAQRSVGLVSGPDAALWERVFDSFLFIVYGGLHRIVQPVYAANPLDLVSAGELVAWSSVLHMLLVKVLLYSGVLACLGGWHLAHREVALPVNG